MKKLILGIIIISTMISLSNSVTSFSVVPKDIQQHIIKKSIDVEFYPTPGDLSPNFKGLDIQNLPQKNLPHHKIEFNSFNSEILDLILQLDEEILLRYLENLTAFGPRVTGEIECEQAGDYIYNEFQSMGLDVRYHEWSYGGYSDRNIEATLQGENVSSDEIYIICGHYDSVAGSPGADDDGSGVVALMSAAYILSKYAVNYTIRFVAFSGEEQGLLGSHEYVVEAVGNGDNIVATLNADMIAYAVSEFDGNNVKVYEDDYSEWITDFMVDIEEEYHDYIELNLIPSGWSWGSDHYYFWEFGYNAIFLHEYNFNDFYHSPEDIIENLNVSYLIKTSRLLLATLAEFTQTQFVNSPPETPTIDGPLNGRPEVNYYYTFSATDPDNDRVYFYVNWDDGNTEEWIGPYNSEEMISINHSWNEHGTYVIKAKARDTYNLESEWGSLEVIIPKTRLLTSSFLLQISEKLLNLFPILKNKLSI